MRARNPVCQPARPLPSWLRARGRRAAARGARRARGRAFDGLGGQTRAVRAQERKHVCVAVPHRVQRGRAAVAVHRVHARAMAWHARMALG